MIKAESVC